MSLLLDIVKAGNLVHVQQTLQTLEDTEQLDAVNEVDELNRTPLHWAVLLGFTDIVNALLAVPGIQVNILDRDAFNLSNRSPLHYAVQMNLPPIAQLLANSANTDVNLVDNDGVSPLTRAARLGLVDMVNILINAPGIQINQAHRINGATAFHDAVIYHSGCPRSELSRRHKIINAFLAVPALDVNQRAHNGRTALWFSLISGCHALIRGLIYKGARIDLVDEKGQHLLDAVSSLKLALQTYEHNYQTLRAQQLCNALAQLSTAAPSEVDIEDEVSELCTAYESLSTSEDYLKFTGRRIKTANGNMTSAEIKLHRSARKHRPY